MDSGIRTDTLAITPTILKLIAEIDEFKGAWTAIGRISPERLDAPPRWRSSIRVQHIRRRALQVRGGGQLYNATGPKACQRIETEFGTIVVRLVDNHERTSQAEHVGE